MNHLEVFNNGVANRPDLNCIENCCSIIESRMAKGGVEEKYADRAAWVEGFAETFQDLAHEGILSKCIRSMPQRLKDVVAARGGPTKW